MPTSLPLSIRTITENDLENAAAILTSAFQRVSDWAFDLRMYSRVQPEGWIMAWQGAKPVGMVGALNYGPFAHVGFMGVIQEAQKQGIGLALMEALLERLDQQEVPQVWLDASAAGQPLYERLGFVAHQRTFVCQRSGHSPEVEPFGPVEVLRPAGLDELVRFDREFFGAERGSLFRVLLENFPSRAFLLRNEADQISGFIFAQKGRIGPWVARNPQDAEALFRAALSLSFEQSVAVAPPEENLAALELLKRYGFEEGRANRHMVRGAGEMPGKRHMVYSQTSFAVG